MHSTSNASTVNSGLIQTTVAFFIWGFFPVYWVLLSHIAPSEVLAHRILWSFIFLFALAMIRKRLHRIKAVFTNKRTLFILVLTALLVSFNWLLFIWAVSNNYVIESSMGYYINPLFSMFLGALFLKERLRLVQYIAISFAVIGVLVLTFAYGRLPIVALSLAISFGFYGLLRKLIDTDGQTALLVETFLVILPAVLYLYFLAPDQAILNDSLETKLLLIGGGIATSLPLILLANGLKVLTLSTVGFLQYITPTLHLFLGVFYFKEAFDSNQLISFIFIWIGLLIYSGEAFFNFKKATK